MLEMKKKMKVIVETVVDENYLELVLTKSEVDNLRFGELLTIECEIEGEVYNVGVRAKQIYE